VDCWFDKDANVDRCRLTDSKGTGLFEDVFVPCVGQTPLPQGELILDSRRTGNTWTQSRDTKINVLSFTRRMAKSYFLEVVTQKRDKKSIVLMLENPLASMSDIDSMTMSAPIPE
jgi:hypothetical protein